MCGGGIKSCGGGCFFSLSDHEALPPHLLSPPQKLFSEYHAPPNSSPPILCAWVTFPAEKKLWSWGHFLGPGPLHLQPPSHTPPLPTLPPQAMTTDTKKKAWRVASKAGKKGDAIAAVKGRRLLLRTFSEPVPAGKGKLCECVCVVLWEGRVGVVHPHSPAPCPASCHPPPPPLPSATYKPTHPLPPPPSPPHQTQGTPRRM